MIGYSSGQGSAAADLLALLMGWGVGAAQSRNIPMEKYIGKLVKVSFKGKDPVDGLVLDYSDEWVLMKRNSMDYVIDGYAIVKRKSITAVERGEREKFKEKIIKLKGSGGVKKMGIPLDNLETILRKLTSEFKVFTLYGRGDTACWLGRFVEINDKTLVIEYLTTRAIWSGQMNLKVSEIRIIEFDDDYTNSLKLVARKPRLKAK